MMLKTLPNLYPELFGHISSLCNAITRVTYLLLHRCDREEQYQPEVVRQVVDALELLIRMWLNFIKDYPKENKSPQTSYQPLIEEYRTLYFLMEELEADYQRLARYRSKVALRAVHDCISDIIEAIS